MMSKTHKKLFTLFIFAAALAAACGGYIYYEQKQQARLEAERIRAEKIAERKETIKRIQSLFDDYLNEMLAELRQKTTLYKQNKTLLARLINPINYTTAEYAKENYTIFIEDIAPSLRKQSEEIIGIFQTYKNKLDSDIADSDDQIKQHFKEKWETEIGQKQMRDYIQFFMKEEKLLRAYEQLIKFYYVYSKRYSVDEEENTFVFANEKDANIHMLLREQLDTIKAMPTDEVKSYTLKTAPQAQTDIPE